MSEIRANTISDAAGTGPITLTKQSAAKVFCQFDGDAATPTPNESLNVSSITDNGTGDYTLTFSNAMSSDNHASMGTRQWNGVLAHDAYTTTTCRYISRSAASTTMSDSYNTATATFGDLA
jgi:hypothetical protein